MPSSPYSQLIQPPPLPQPSPLVIIKFPKKSPIPYHRKHRHLRHYHLCHSQHPVSPTSRSYCLTTPEVVTAHTSCLDCESCLRSLVFQALSRVTASSRRQSGCGHSACTPETGSNVDQVFEKLHNLVVRDTMEQLFMELFKQVSKNNRFYECCCRGKSYFMF